MTFQKIIREPMVHFLLIGAVLFVAFSALSGPEEENPDIIRIQSETIEQLDYGFERTWMRPPTPKERELLVDEYLREEVFYREAVILGMDQGDSVIRKRLRQKLELILEDVSKLSPPTDEDLAQFLQDNPDKFSQQPQLAIRHIYFNPDKHPQLDQDVEEAMKALSNGTDPNLLGDAFLIGQSSSLTQLDRISRDFGANFAQDVALLPVGEWGGPIASGYGLHLVIVDQMVDGRLPEVDEIREKILVEWQRVQKSALEDATFQKLLSKYEVEIDLPLAETDDLAESGK